MLILATLAIDLAAVSIWSAIYGQNGFAEVGKLLRGEPSFVPDPDKGLPGVLGSPAVEGVTSGLKDVWKTLQGEREIPTKVRPVK